MAGSTEEVYQMAEAGADARNRERDKLLILLLFETGLRVSEALSLTPRLIGQSEGKPVIYLKKGKGQKPRMVACPEDLAHRIRSFAYQKQIGPDDRIFPNRGVSFKCPASSTLSFSQ
jgi:integrase